MGKSEKERFCSFKGFSLFNVIIIIVITAIASAITTGVIANNNFRNKNGISYKTILEDEKLSEFIDVYSSVLAGYYENVDKDEMLDAALSAMLNYLGDSYTTFMDESQSSSLVEKLEGQYKGMGIILAGNIVISTIKDSPAEKIGLQKGDTVLSIDNTDITGLSSQDMKQVIKDSSNKESVHLKIMRNNEELEFDVKTDTLFVPALEYHLENDTKIGYIYISVFSNTVYEQFNQALKELENSGMEKLIIDVRGNSGGYLTQAERIAQLFLKKDQVIYTLENKNKKTSYVDKTDEHRDYSISVLIDKDSASASEILAAALKDSYGASLIGTNSYGKGKVQQTVMLKDQTMAKYTTAKWLRPNGECVDGVGLVPDVNVELLIEKDSEGAIISVQDTQLAKAIELLQ